MRTVYIMYIIHCKLGVSFKSMKIIYTAGYIPLRSRAHVCECIRRMHEIVCARVCMRTCSSFVSMCAGVLYVGVVHVRVPDA